LNSDHQILIGPLELSINIQIQTLKQFKWYEQTYFKFKSSNLDRTTRALSQDPNPNKNNRINTTVSLSSQLNCTTTYGPISLLLLFSDPIQPPTTLSKPLRWRTINLRTTKRRRSWIYSLQTLLRTFKSYQ